MFHVKARRDYFERVLREGFYINQVNSELVDFLNKRLNDDNNYKQIAEANKPTLPNPSKPKNNSKKTDENYNEKLKLGNYHSRERVNCPIRTANNIKKNTNNCNKYITQLYPEFLKEFGDNTTYIMICNIRKEIDDKFRNGAIDTLKLVDKLKST
jgi:hypothetical protein